MTGPRPSSAGAGFLWAAVLVVGALLAGCTSGADPAPEEDRVVSPQWRESGTPGATEYVALGDSYVAAPGVPTTDQGNPCLPSSNNYPALVARELDVDRLVDASCGGARTTHMTQPQGPGRPPQFDALSEDTTLVTLTIGGNDHGVFSAIVVDCVAVADQDPAGAPCRAAKESDPSTSLLNLVDRTAASVDDVLTGIEQRAPYATVVVVGYPQFLPATGGCPDLLPIARGDNDYVREIYSRFSLALEQAAADHGVAYVDMGGLSEGHDICSSDPWVNGRHYLPEQAAPYHPFAVEQQAAAAAIVEAVNRQG